MAQLLLVHSDPALLDAMGSHLELEGHDVDMATCGAAALAGARSTSPDLIVIEASRHGVDGMEVLRRLRRTSDVR